jgi:Multisubunit Na+/H+ antiporter, MnhB subunit
MNGMSAIVKTVTRLSAPFLVLFGIYMFMHGHRSHGVGFAGGVIIALAFMLFLISFGKEAAIRKMSEKSSSLYLNLAFLVLLIVSVVGIVYGHALLPAPGPDGLFGAPLLLAANAALCVTTAGSLFIIFLNLVSFKGEKDKR